jgi:hypothetical protein
MVGNLPAERDYGAMNLFSTFDMHSLQIFCRGIKRTNR